MKDENPAPEQGTVAATEDTLKKLPKEKVIVAIHGIGNQTRSDTVRSVAHQFATLAPKPLPVMPLGFFYIEKIGKVLVSKLDAPGTTLADIGFAELYWADIPRELVKTADTLEETKAWGRTVVSRAQTTYLRSVQEQQLVPNDFAVGAGVIEEIVEGIGVLENLCTLSAKAGLFKFDLPALLRDYVDDVQVVAEFKYHRQRIVYRFHSLMAQIVALAKRSGVPDPDIYVVAHSEGTVVSFLAILQALSGTTVVDPADESEKPQPLDTSWICHLRGFMTIGSPIDKHLLLWPDIWDGLQLHSRRHGGKVLLLDENGNARAQLPKPIEWRNYYDFGDPVGFKLETAELFLKQQKCEAFNFETSKHDHGFSRYPFPGKAHVDYWGDAGVFGHFIHEVVLGEPSVPPPPNRPVRAFLGTALPYVITFFIHIAAVFVLYKGLSAFLDDDRTPSQVAAQMLVLGALFMSVTAAARLPRLTRAFGRRWHAAAFAALLVGALACWFGLPDQAALFFAHREQGATDAARLLADKDHAVREGKLLLIAGAAFVAFSGWITPRKPRWGRYSLVATGAVVVLFILVRQGIVIGGKDALWPAVLAALASLYLWWLGILLFDLTFIWHRYIRQSVAIDTLKQWVVARRDAEPRVMAKWGRPSRK